MIVSLLMKYIFKEWNWTENIGYLKTQLRDQQLGGVDK